MLLQVAALATLVTADQTQVPAWYRGSDTLWVTNQTWVSTDSAPALGDCVYSGNSLRMLARDSMHVTITDHHWKWERTLKPGQSMGSGFSAPLGEWQFTLLDVSAPASQCGVNAGQIWFHWTLERRALHAADPKGES